MRASPGKGSARRRTETSGTTTHVPQPPDGTLHPGLVLGDRYAIREQLGRGGMGDVWLAHDLKLRVDVALKAIRPEHQASDKRRELLRAEVRAAREVVSPNVCRVFDLVVEGDRELVSMEYVDGVTLAALLDERAPFDIAEARDLAAQFLAGLEAIHRAGLVHRDFKPENVMVTPAGRVVVMDLGIAQRAEDPSGTAVGTPAYMAPEQSGGGELDARADVFAAGVALAEMTAPGDAEERKALLEDLRSDPPRVPEGPWSGVIRRAVSPHAGDRYASARELSRALDSVTLRVAGEDDRRPYPGLSAFTEAEAEHFFGREAEVEALLRKLSPAARLLALAGPSGAGKTSFVRAGLIPALPEGWRAVVFHPRERPFAAMAQALVPELSGDEAAMDELVRLEDPGAALSALRRWRRRHERVLLVADQFEELFTLSPPVVQGRFAELLGRLPLEADVHALLVMRDDFLIRCQEHEALTPIASELSLLTAPTGAALRRALVQPALACGYRFEDEALAEEMLDEVERERGGLPLLAFAAGRLWEQRDRERGLLTREAHASIGGVAGALAQHAEATLGRIGPGREPIVRELFRNLVTAQGTRASRERDELLSVFEDREPAAEVLAALVDARLLTSYEPPAGEGEQRGRQQIEIVHESLLAAWPRLVRWRAQDADGARLRDQLRQAALIWEERGRPDDLLWTGASFKEYELWRERYPGGLSAQEEAFAAAMADRATRRRRRRRLTVGAVVALAVSVAAVTTSLWRRSETAREQARGEALRAEASALLARAELRREEDPTEALAYTTASLELADTDEARVFALRVLWEAPPARELVPPGGEALFRPSFSPAGSRLALAGLSPDVWVWTAEGGDPPLVLPGHEASTRFHKKAWWASEELLVAGAPGFFRRRCHVWRLPGGERVRTIDFGGPTWWQTGPDTLFAITREDAQGRELFRLRSWRLPDGEAQELGRVDWSGLGASWPATPFVPNGRGLLSAKGDSVYLRPLPAGGGDDRLLGRHPAEVTDLWPLLKGLDPARVYSTDTAGGIRLWDLSQEEPKLAKSIPPTPGLESEPVGRRPDPTARWAAEPFASGGRARVWNLDAWPRARPLSLRRGGSWRTGQNAFAPRGDWLAVSRSARRLTFWPLRGVRPSVVGYSGPARPLAFGPDGRWLATLDTDDTDNSYSDTLLLWPLPGSGSHEARTLTLPEFGWWTNLAFDPGGRFLLVVGNEDRAYVVPLNGSPPRKLEGFSRDTTLLGAAVSPSGRRVATAFFAGKGSKTLRVWELETGERRLFDLPPGSFSALGARRGVRDLAFADESTLYTAGVGGVRRWDVETGTHEPVFPTEPGYGAMMALGPAGRIALVDERPLEDATGPMKRLDPATGAAQALPAFGNSGHTYDRLDHPSALDSSGTVAATGDREGIVRIGRVTGGKPHLLVGHQGPVDHVAISPDGRWVASTGQDATLRLWPMPDLSKPALHTLPHDELVAKLKSLTNVRVVRDPEAAEGWKVELAPFPGWKDVPEW